MGARAWATAVVAWLVASAPPATADTRDYGGTSDACRPLGVAPAPPVSLCSTSQAGTLAVDPATCDAGGCVVAAAGTASTRSAIPSLVTVESRLEFLGGSAPLCAAASPPGAQEARCAGTASLALPVGAPECRNFFVKSFVGTLHGSGIVSQEFSLCRDAGGVPAILVRSGA